MGKKKKNKKKQVPKATHNTVEVSKPAPAENAEKPIEESDSTPVEAAISETAAEPRSDATKETETVSGVLDLGSAEDVDPPQTPEEPQISTVEEKINHDIQTKSRLKRMLPDIVRVALAFSVILIGAAIWWKPPLMDASFPVTTYKYKNHTVREAALYRPLAMQERYYVKLPEKLENRYEWFAIDRRREVVALAEEPKHSFLGRTAIKRADPLGLDLEFRKLDGHEWLIYFYQDAIVFSNNLLTVRLDAKNPVQ